MAATEPSAASAASARKRRAFDAFDVLGIVEPWQLVLLPPSSYEDAIAPLDDATALDATVPAALTFRIAGPVSTSGSRGVPRATFSVRDRSGGTYRATIFGNAKEWADRLERDQVYTFLCTGKPFNGEFGITCRELVEPEYVGRIRPTYPARKTRLPADVVRKVIERAVTQQVNQAVEFVRGELTALAPMATLLACVGCPGWTLAQLMREVHLPSSMAYAEHARGAYLQLAALGALNRMHIARPEIEAPSVSTRTLEERIRSLPFTLTADQERAASEIGELLGRPRALRHVLFGDVGTGKTYVASLVIGCVVDASAAHRALVMAPNATLAAQFQREFAVVCPDINTALVTGESDCEDPTAYPVVFGTSAVLSRNVGAFTLVVVDEQHRWSRAQREHHTGSQVHLLELSATCIPRTQALIQFGKITASEMRQTHKTKCIHTRLWEGRDGLRRLFQGIQRVVEEGRSVVVVYPKREVSGRTSNKQDAAPGIDDRHSVEAALPRWEQMFPGQVRAITSDDEDTSKQAALADIEGGRARILICTLVVEVGLNIEGLRNIVIVHPDRYGLSTLHQLRGRVARMGGEGFCELLLPEPVSAKARARLDALMSTTDGFELSRMDLELRGTGDLSRESLTQSGADRTFLFGIPLTTDLLAEVTPIWERVGPT